MFFLRFLLVFATCFSLSAQPCINDPSPRSRVGRLVFKEDFNDSVFTEDWLFRSDRRFRKIPFESLSIQVMNLVYLNYGFCFLKTRTTQEPFTFFGSGLISRRFFKNGFFECRLRLPSTPGIHTSFWLMKNPSHFDWNKIFIEIDIMEHDSGDSYYTTNVHYHKEPASRLGPRRVFFKQEKQVFRLFGLLLDDKQAHFFLDGALVHTYTFDSWRSSESNIWISAIGWPLNKVFFRPNEELDVAVFDFVYVYSLN